VENQEAYEKAKKRVEAKIGFYIHLAVYVGVNILLIISNLLTSTQELWFRWPLIGWGIGIFFHALGVFAFTERSSIKERMIEKEMKKEALKKQ
jgi:bacteriorhodopsin